MSAERDVAVEHTWRPSLSSSSNSLLIFLIVVMAVQSFSFVHRWATGSADTVDDVFGVFFLAYTVVAVVALPIYLVRARVRLTAGGLEIRRWRTRRFGWAEIADVRLDRGSNDRMIKLYLSDGRTVRLPAPTRSWIRPPDQTLIEAVAAIRERAGLGPVGPPLP